MLIIAGRQEQLTRAMRAVAKDFDERVADELRGIRSVADLGNTVKDLRKQVEELEISKARKEEEFARKEREIEHKVGLERARQKMELDAGKRAAVLEVREENLKADQTRFTEQMAFHEKRFTDEVGYLKELMESLMQRLPDVSASLELGGRARGRTR